MVSNTVSNVASLRACNWENRCQAHALGALWQYVAQGALLKLQGEGRNCFACRLLVGRLYGASQRPWGSCWLIGQLSQFQNVSQIIYMNSNRAVEWESRLVLSCSHLI